MKKIFYIFATFFITNFAVGQKFIFDDLEKNAGQYYTNIEASLIANKFEFVNYDSSKKKLVYQQQPESYLTTGNKYCYVWRSDDDKAKIITYLTTDYNEFIEWKKAMMLKGFKTKPIVNEIDGTKEWFYNKKHTVKVLKKQVAAAEKGKKIIMYIISIVKN